MNRRQFTVSLGALSGTAALPFSTVQIAATAPTAAVTPPHLYAWAQLIARAQAKTTPAMLGRQLRLAPDIAQGLFNTLVQDGVLRSPTAVGIAQAAQPLQSTGHSAAAPQSIRTRTAELLRQTKRISEETQPLVNADDPEIVCSETAEKDPANARTDQSIQESPRCG